MDRNTILTIGVIVGAILVLVGLAMLTSKRFTQVSEGSFGGLFKIQGPVGAVVAALGVILLVTCISKLGDEPAAAAGSSSATGSPLPPSSSASESISPTILPPASPVKGVTITAPVPDQLVSSSEGVVVEGTAGGLGNDTLWLFDVVEGPDRKPIYYEDTEEPLVIINDHWRYDNTPIGSPGSTSELITIAAIRANADCDHLIRGLKREKDGSIILSYPLPASCVQVADVRVVKNRP